MENELSRQADKLLDATLDAIDPTVILPWRKVRRQIKAAQELVKSIELKEKIGPGIRELKDNNDKYEDENKRIKDRLAEK